MYTVHSSAIAVAFATGNRRTPSCTTPIMDYKSWPKNLADYIITLHTKFAHITDQLTNMLSQCLRHCELIEHKTDLTMKLCNVHNWHNTCI